MTNTKANSLQQIRSDTLFFLGRQEASNDLEVSNRVTWNRLIVWHSKIDGDGNWLTKSGKQTAICFAALLSYAVGEQDDGFDELWIDYNTKTCVDGIGLSDRCRCDIFQKMKLKMTKSKKTTISRLLHHPNWFVLIPGILLLFVLLVRDISRGKGWIYSTIILILILIPTGFAWYLERGLQDDQSDQDSTS